MNTPLDLNGQVVKDFNLFIDGRGQAGKIEEIRLPKITQKTVDHLAGGMAGAVKINVGLEPLDVEFTLTQYDPGTLALFGVSQDKPVLLTVRGAVQSGVLPVGVIIRMAGLWQEIDMGSFKKAESVKMKVKVNLTYYSLNVGGVQCYDIDMANNIFMVSGVDQNLAVKAIIGM